MTIICPRNTAILLVVMASLLLVSCGEIDPEGDPRAQVGAEPSGRILFVSQGDVHLWDGSTTQLTEFGNAGSPAWGPNGEQYLFVRYGDAFSDLYVGNLLSGDFRNLTNNEPPFEPGTPEYLNQVLWALDPTWSPSGDGIAYASDLGTSKNLLWYKPGVDAQATRVSCSAINDDNVETPDFSPDGSQVVFAQREASTTELERWTELRICDLSTGELTELVTGNEAAFYPTWSPDGEWIAFVRRVDERTDLWVVPADGGEPTRLTNEGDITAPEWSPDGRMIGFVDGDGAGFKVSYVEFTVDEGGQPSASDPSELFNSDGIDAPSGISWTE